MNKYQILYFILFILLFSLIFSCNKNEIRVHPNSSYYYTKKKKKIIVKYKSNGAGLFPFSYTVRKDVDADPITFEYLGEGFARDKNYLFKDAIKLTEINPNTFKIIGIFFKDDNNVYYTRSFSDVYQKIDQVDAKTFTNYNNWLYKDKNHVYISKNEDLKIIKDADPETFEVVKFTVCKDKNYVYIYNIINTNIDPKSLTYNTETGTFIDKNNSYKFIDNQLVPIKDINHKKTHKN